MTETSRLGKAAKITGLTALTAVCPSLGLPYLFNKAGYLLTTVVAGMCLSGLLNITASELSASKMNTRDGKTSLKIYSHGTSNPVPLMITPLTYFFIPSNVVVKKNLGDDLTKTYAFPGAEIVFNKDKGYNFRIGEGRRFNVIDEQGGNYNLNKFSLDEAKTSLTTALNKGDVISARSLSEKYTQAQVQYDLAIGEVNNVLENINMELRSMNSALNKTGGKK